MVLINIGLKQAFKFKTQNKFSFFFKRTLMPSGVDEK